MRHFRRSVVAVLAILAATACKDKKVDPVDSGFGGTVTPLPPKPDAGSGAGSGPIDSAPPGGTGGTGTGVASGTATGGKGGTGGGVTNGGGVTGSAGTGKVGGTGRGGTSDPGLTIPSSQPSVADVEFASNPAGATFVLSQGGKTVQTGQTPAKLTLPPGAYDWVVSKDGFLVDSSSGDGLRLLRGSNPTFSVSLTKTGDPAIAEKAEAAFVKGDCEDAVRLFRAMQRPAERDSRLNERWVESRMKLSKCYKKLGDASGAVQVLRALRQDEAARENWVVVYELGIAECGNLAFKPGLQSFSELNGQIINRVARENRAAVRALAYYGKAYCGYQDFSSRNGAAVSTEFVAALVDDFETFFNSAERALTDAAMSPDVKARLAGVVREGEGYRRKLP